jgi:hypothetical protein
MQDQLEQRIAYADELINDRGYKLYELADEERKVGGK